MALKPQPLLIPSRHWHKPIVYSKTPQIDPFLQTPLLQVPLKKPVCVLKKKMPAFYPRADQPPPRPAVLMPTVPIQNLAKVVNANYWDHADLVIHCRHTLIV